MPDFILDTNAVRYLVSPDWTSEAAKARMLERAEEGQLVIKYTPFAAIEMISQIEEDRTMFGVIKEAASMLVELRATALPDPEDVMGEILLDLPYSRKNAEVWEQIIEALAKGPDAKSIVSGFKDYKTAQVMGVDLPRLAAFRQRYEQDYMHAWRAVLGEIVPDFEERVAATRHTRLEKSEIAKLDDFLKESCKNEGSERENSEWEKALLIILHNRSQKSVPRKDYEVAAVLAKIKYYREGFEWLIRKSAKDGLRPDVPKRKNDYNDIHLLLYINDYNFDVIVSQDKEFTKKVSCSGKRLIGYPDFIAQATGVSDGE